MIKSTDNEIKRHLLWLQRELISRRKPVGSRRTDSVKKWRPNPAAKCCPAVAPRAAPVWLFQRKDKNPADAGFFIEKYL